MNFVSRNKFRDFLPFLYEIFLLVNSVNFQILFIIYDIFYGFKSSVFSIIRVMVFKILLKYSYLDYFC